MAETKESDDTPTSPPKHPGPPPDIHNWADYMRKHKHKRRVCSHYGEEYTPSHPMLQCDCMQMWGKPRPGTWSKMLPNEEKQQQREIERDQKRERDAFDRQFRIARRDYDAWLKTSDEGEARARQRAMSSAQKARRYHPEGRQKEKKQLYKMIRFLENDFVVRTNKSISV